MRLHDRLYTHIDEEKVGVYMFRKRFATWCVCVYVCLAACLSKQLGIASKRTSLLLCELCVELAPYRSFARSNWDAFSQLEAIYERQKERKNESMRSD
jgi:hypothetical protein